MEEGEWGGLSIDTMSVQGRTQDLVRGGSDKLPPKLSDCYCCLTSAFFTRKSTVKIFAFVSFRGFDQTT